MLQIGLLFQPHLHHISIAFVKHLALACMDKGLKAVKHFIYFVAICEGYRFKGVHDHSESFSEFCPNIETQICA